MTSREMFPMLSTAVIKFLFVCFQTHKCSCCLKIFYKTFQQYSKLLNIRCIFILFSIVSDKKK